MTINGQGADSNVSINVTPKGTGSTNFTVGDVGIGSTTPNVSLDVGAKTDAIALPSGLSSQRPTTGVANGDIRYSQSLNAVEAYINGAWENWSLPAGLHRLSILALRRRDESAAFGPARNRFYSANSGKSGRINGNDVAWFLRRWPKSQPARSRRQLFYWLSDQWE